MLGLFILLLSGCEGEPELRQADPAPQIPISSESATRERLIGSAACIACHPDQGRAWRSSHHGRAMEKALPETVEAPFDGETFKAVDQRWQFIQEGSEYWVLRREGEGEPDRLRVLFTFGVDPLQQYLVERPRGRMQALPVAWDARSAAEGGQRWFSLNGETTAPPGDPLHWDGLAYNWNSQCASCHSTAFVKGFDDSSNAFHSTFAEMDVACEACHGPGSRHQADPEAVPALLSVPFETWGSDRWIRPKGQRISARRVPHQYDHELDTCGGCHARRSPLVDGVLPGARLLDVARPSLVSAGLYFDDGQIRDEVYVWGSFMQSRMYAAGVRCSDCHDPHSLLLRRPGNALCTGCHAPEVFDGINHHGHEPEASGSNCVDCHMPRRTYMEVDARGDHSFPVPRPAISSALGAPDVCTSCHSEQTATWAAQAIQSGEVGGRQSSASRVPHWTQALIDASGASRTDERRWLEIATDDRTPELIRASAWVRYAQEAKGAPPLAFLEARFAAADSLERLGLVEIARRLAPAPRIQLLVPLLSDDARSVRAAAAEALLGVPAEDLPPAARSALGRGLREYREAQEANAERPEAQVNLAGIALAYGEAEEARAAYERAIERAPYFVPAHVNLADLERSAGREEAAIARLRKALALAPEDTQIRYALGLALHRAGKAESALEELSSASFAAPEDARLRLAHALSLDGLGRRSEAIERLAEGVRSGRADADVFQAWASLLRDQGDFDAARAAAEAWHQAVPDDPRRAAFLLDLKAREEGISLRSETQSRFQP